MARVSGKVDAVRLPKPIYFAYRVMQNPQPDVHILGHWTYPAGNPQDRVRDRQYASGRVALERPVVAKGGRAQRRLCFRLSGRQIGSRGRSRPTALNDGKEVARQELTTVGAAKRIKLTPIVGPAGFLANGADVALIDVEVVDEQGRRCPTDDARVDFMVSGPAIWRGGYNSGKTGSTNNLYLNTECGVNRVAIRSTLQAGTDHRHGDTAWTGEGRRANRGQAGDGEGRLGGTATEPFAGAVALIAQWATS